MYKYDEVIDVLNSNFPEVKSIYDDNIDDYEELPYIFYESVFVKYIIKQIKLCEEDRLREIFYFIEQLLLNGDDNVKNLISVAVVESIYFEKNFETISKTISKFYGELTKKCFEECNTN